MTDLPHDYGEPEEPPEDVLKKLQTLCAALVGLMGRRMEQVEALEKTDAQIKQISEKMIPEAMGSIGLRSIGTESGVQVTIAERIHASLPSARERPQRRQQVLDAVRRTGNEGIIKTTFRVSYGRDAATHVETFRRILREHGVEGHARISLDETIHPGTFKKFVRDLAASQPDTDLEEFGAHRQIVAEVEI